MVSASFAAVNRLVFYFVKRFSKWVVAEGNESAWHAEAEKNPRAGAARLMGAECIAGK